MDKYSNLINEIAVCGEEDVINRLQKVAQTLAIGNEDLADYLSLAIKIATNNEKKNSKISLAYIKNKLSKEAAENFEKEYEKERIEPSN